MNLKSKIAIMLAVLTTASFTLMSCASTAGTDQPSDIQTTAADVSEETTAAETVDMSYVCEAPVTDMEGRTLNFLLNGVAAPNTWSEIDIIREEITGEVINDSIIERNRDMEERYNVIVSGTYDASEVATFNKLVQSGDSTYDAVFLQMAAAGSAAKSGYLQNYNDMPYIDTNKGYWDSSIIDCLSVGGDVYMLTGDISTIDNQATWILMFNKEMVDEYSVDNPYKYVLDGSWTIDLFSSMVKNITSDIDGNGEMDKFDQYGMATTADTVYGLFYSCGASLVTKDTNDYPVFALDQNKVSTIFEKSIDILSSENTLVSGRIKGSADVIADIRTAFEQKRALFYCEVMYHVANLRQMETDFGIIPMPKFDDKQENYITFVNPASTVLLVPVTNQDLETTGLLLEAFAASSYKYVTPAYYDTALVSKYTRDEESKEMLDLLLVNRTYDLGLIYGWGSFLSKYNALVVDGKANLSSLIAESETKINSEIEKFVSDISENNT